MATSAARIRSLYRRNHQAQEAVYHFNASSSADADPVTSSQKSIGNAANMSADERFRAALRREMAKAGLI